MIVLVDDSATQRESLAVQLQRAGYTVRVCESAVEALREIDSRRPLVLITDLVMPDVNGIELVRRVRANPATADIPVIVTTALPPPWPDFGPKVTVLPKAFKASELVELLHRIAPLELKEPAR